MKRAIEIGISKNVQQLEIKTQSRYCIKSLTKWHHNYNKNGEIWLHKSRFTNYKWEPVVHTDQLRKIEKMVDESKIEVRYLHGKGR